MSRKSLWIDGGKQVPSRQEPWQQGKGGGRFQGLLWIMGFMCTIIPLGLASYAVGELYTVCMPIFRVLISESLTKDLPIFSLCTTQVCWQKITEAYEVLHDTDKRKNYDQHLDWIHVDAVDLCRILHNIFVSLCIRTTWLGQFGECFRFGKAGIQGGPGGGSGGP